MATKRELNFLTQALHHLVKTDAHLSQGARYLRAFVNQDDKQIDKVLVHLGFKLPDDKLRKEIGLIYSKMKRQWKDSRSLSHHTEVVDCDCHLCLLDKLRDYALNGVPDKNA